MLKDIESSAAALYDGGWRMRINIYNSESYFTKEDGKWFLTNEDGDKKEVSINDCDIDLLDCACDSDTVYGSAVFGEYNNQEN